MRKINDPQNIPAKIGDNNAKFSKSTEDLFGYHFLNKSQFITKNFINEQIAFQLKNTLDQYRRLGKKIEIPYLIEGLKNTSIRGVVGYCSRELGISLPKDLYNKINIFVYEGSEDADFKAGVVLNDIIINNAVFQKLSEKRQLELLIHEILHIVAGKQMKVYYDWPTDKIEKVTSGPQTGYSNPLIGGHNNIKLGESLNEGFTEMIALAISHKYSLDDSVSDNEQRNVLYLGYVYIIDGLVTELSRKLDTPYQEILKYLMTGNILSNPKYLSIITDNIGKEFLDDLLKHSTDFTPKDPFDVLVEFRDKYKSIYSSKYFSEDMKKVIGNIDLTFTG